MKYTQLGRSGLTVSTVGLGCNNFGTRIDLERTREVVDAAIESGITFFDTADIYGLGQSEKFLGEATKGKRDGIVLATKVGKPMNHLVAPEHEARGGRRYIRAAVESSLRRLQTDRIDLLQLHEPDPRTPLEETLSALDALVHEGKVLYLGSSGMASWQVAEADLVARELGVERFISVQEEYSLLNRAAERELIPAAEHFGVSLIPFFPLANGLLSGKYSRETTPSAGRLAEPAKAGYLTPENFATVDSLRAFAEVRGVSLIDVAIAGLAAMPGVATVIAGATSPDQVHANAASAEWMPSAEDLEELRALTKGHV